MQSNTGHQPIILSPGRITRLLQLCIGLLFIGHLGAFYLDYVRRAGSRTAKNLVKWFDFNLENNVPTWFSVCILALSMLLLLVIYLHHREAGKKDAHFWRSLSLVFLFLSVDEMVQVHEEVARILRPELGAGVPSIFYWAWVIPYGLFAIGAGLYFLRFVRSLPPDIRNLFFISGAMFVTGALGMELLEGHFYVKYGLNHIYNRILYCVEELLEMGGITLFIHALLRYMEGQRIGLSLTRG